MTTFTLVMVTAPFMPVVLIAGFISAVLPLVVLLLIRRRSTQLSWGSMWLIQETLRKRAPLKLLRVILFVVRSMLLPIAALALVGLWFNAPGVQGGRPQVIILDDSIGSWIPGSDDRCAIDDHLDVIEQIQTQSSNVVHVVLLSGRSIVHPDTIHLRGLKPVSSGPDWVTVTQQVNDLVKQHKVKRVLLISDLRGGVLKSFEDESITNVRKSFVQPATTTRDTVRITGVDTPRDVLLPGDPFQKMQLMINLSRSNAASQEQTKALLDVIGSDNISVEAQYQAILSWNAGEHQRRLSMMLPNTIPSNGLLHVHIEGSTSPAAQWWVRIRKPEFPQVTMLTNEREHLFDPTSAASWLATGVKAGSSGDDLTLQWLRHENLQVDSLASHMPILVTTPSLLTPATWTALCNRSDTGPILIIPPIDASPSWLNNALRTMVGFDHIGDLQIVQPTTKRHEVTIADEAGSLELIASELPQLLQSIQIERMIDLRSLVTANIGRSIVSIDQFPLFVQIHDSNIVVSALAWHPSWSDLPVRSAAPVLLQEILRSKVGFDQSMSITASSPHDRNSGPRIDGVVVQPDTASANQSTADQSSIQQLLDVGWVAHEAHVTVDQDDIRSPIVSALVLLLLCLDITLAHTINRQRRSGRVVTRTVGT